MSWLERYHVVLGATALAVGLAVAVVEWWSPAIVSRRLLAVAGLAGAVLGGWGTARAWPWWLAAGLVVIVADDGAPEHQHPLGRSAGILAAVGLVGVWAAVPDTEPPLVVAALLTPVVASQAVRHRSIGRAGTAALVVSVLGAVWVGSAGWGSALAAVCAVGAVGVAPLVLGFARPLVGPAWWTLLGAHLVVVLSVPRPVMRWSVPLAWCVSLGSLLVIGLAAALVAVPRWRRSVLWSR